MQITDTMKLERSHLAVLHATVKEAGRFQMVHVGPAGLTATDGHMLVRTSWNGTDVPEVRSRVLELSSVQALRKAMSKKTDTAMIETAPAESSTSETASIGSMTAALKHSEDRWPAIETVIPAVTSEHRRICLSVDLLARMVKAAQEFGAEYVHVSVPDVRKPKPNRFMLPDGWPESFVADAVRIDASHDGKSILGVIMPAKPQHL